MTLTPPPTTPPWLAPAWASALHWAIGSEMVRADFEAATGRRWESARTPIDRMVDEATGANRAYVEAFVDWFNEHVWGDVDDDGWVP